MRLIVANEATASRRRVFFQLVDATDGITPETGEASGQPQVSSDGGAWTNTGISTLTAIGNGRYYADLTQTLVATAGTQIETRYKSAATAECPGDSVQVVAYNPYDSVRLGLTALPNAAVEASGGLITRGTGTGQISLSSGAVTVGTNNDKTGYSLTQSFPANFSSLAITAGGAVTAGTVSDKTGYSLTQSFPSNFASLAITAGGAVTAGTVSDKTGYSLATAPPTSADIADAVWDEALSGHLTAGSTGNALNAAGSAGDPWATTLPGAYGVGTAGRIIGDNINATISSRLASSAITLSSGAVTVGTNNDKTGYSLSQSFPSNFSSLAITAGGAVTAGTVSDKTGYSLSSSQTFNVTGNITGNLSGSVGSVTGAVGSVTNAVTVGTINNDVITAASISADAGAEIADAVWDETTSGHTTAGTYGGRVLRATNSNVEVQVTGSNHVAADIHELQPLVITSGDFSAGAINANALATDAVTEIAQGVLSEATSTNPLTYAAGDVGNILGRLHNMIEADGANFRYTANALEEAPSGGGGGGSTTVRMGPFTVVAEGQGSDEILDINKGATHGIDCKLVDAFGTGIDLTGATIDVYIYSIAGALAGSVSATGTYEAGGDITWTIPTTVTNTAGTYTAVIRRETSATDVQFFGPLRIRVRSN